VIRCGKLAEPKSFAFMVVRAFAMSIDDGVVPCDAAVEGAVSPNSC